MSCISCALRLLAVKGRFSLELEQKLKTKGFASEEIKAAIQECTQRGYLNDEERIGQFIEREKRKGFGPYAIGFKLKALGWKETDPIFQEHMRALKKEEPALLRALLKKHGNKDKKKLVMFLQRRGFSKYADRDSWD